MALVATTLVFACFSLSAAVAQRRSFLYLAGLLSSALSVLFWWRMGMSLFARGSGFGFTAELLVGLGVFLGYVLVDTQVGGGCLCRETPFVCWCCDWCFTAMVVCQWMHVVAECSNVSPLRCMHAQMIIERASLGELDEVKHALQLFGDFVAILVRVVILLLQREERAQRERARRERRRQE